MATINRREAAALINSLTAGVVPRIGLRHIAVGRQKEVNAFLHDLETVQDGGAAFRFVCGKYGSGKSFLIQMIRNNAMERSFVVMDADLSPERRLTGTKGQGIATYRELMQHLSTKTRPEGGALESIGDLDTTIQIGAPYTCASFVQRLGRTGRRTGKSQMLFVNTFENNSSNFFDSIPWDLIRSIAIIQLYLEERWVEPFEQKRKPFSLLVHQTLSILMTYGELIP